MVLQEYGVPCWKWSTGLASSLEDIKPGAFSVLILLSLLLPLPSSLEHIPASRQILYTHISSSYAIIEALVLSPCKPRARPDGHTRDK